MKRVVFYASSLYLSKLTGLGYYSYRFISDVVKLFPKNDYYLLGRKTPVHVPSDKIKIISEKNPLLAKLPNPVWFRYFSNRLITPLNPDYVFCLEPYTPLHVKAKKVIVVYDLVLYLYPESMQTKTYLSYRFFFKKAVKEADYIVSISQGTADKLFKILGKKADFIVRPKTDIQPVKDPPIYNFPYILSVSTVEPRKNIKSLIEAFINLKSRGELEGVKLVLVGKYGWKSKGLIETISKHKDYIIHTGYVDRHTLANLYTHARLFILPSIYEGFGIPVLEARKSGCCVITSDIPELQEACGKGCIYIKPTAEELEIAIKHFFDGKLRCDYTESQQENQQDVLSLGSLLD